MSMKHAAALMTPSKPARTSQGGKDVRMPAGMNDMAVRRA
jgi:hypothetical protein